MIVADKEFVLSGIATFLRDSAMTLSALDCGMLEAHASEYIMQTTFLRMTGFLEQKMKCIMWSVASFDMTLRRELLTGVQKIGECSTYKEKCLVLNKLLGSISAEGGQVAINEEGRKSFVEQMKRDMDDFVGRSGIGNFSAAYVQPTLNLLKATKGSQLLCGNGTGKNDSCEYFNGSTGKGQGCVLKGGAPNLKYIYEEIVYRHRNRCAHNALSSQRNFPDIDLVSSSDFVFHNYIMRFGVLELMDLMITSVFRKWVAIVEV